MYKFKAKDFKSNIINFFKDIDYLDVLFAFLGGVILAFVIRNVHEVSPITEGGMLGLVLLIDHWVHISPSITTPIINIICYLFAYKILGKKFIFNSLFAVGGFAIFLTLFRIMPPVIPSVINHPLVASILGGLGVGFSCGLCVLASSAPTADDALVLAVKSKIKISITYVYMISDLVVLALSLTYISWKLIMYSLLTVIISGQTIGLMEKIFEHLKAKYNIDALPHKAKTPEKLID